ncbi:MAG: HD-GYP domain-containing protein [Spirochaetota bacterium]
MKLYLEKIRAGTVLEGVISSPKGEVIYQDKVVLTASLLDKLSKENIAYIDYLAHPKEDYHKTDHEKREEDRLENLLVGYHAGVFDKDSIRSCLSRLRNLTFSFINNHDAIDFQSCKDIILDVYTRIKSNPSAMINLLDLRAHDDYTFCHSVNVAIISLSLAQKMGYTDDEIKLIGLGGLLHDIGKVAIPASLINKTGVLSEEEKRIMKSHPSHSYRIMRLDKTLDPRIMMMAYEHHERYDGNGYPRGIAGDKLHDYSVIVALADVYDALTTVRSYKPAFSPEESIQVIETYTGTHFAPRIAEKFIHDIQTSLSAKTDYALGTLVLLNTEEVAQVVYNKNNGETAEIVVQVLTDSKQVKLRSPKRINLKVDTLRKIVRPLNTEEVDGDTLRVRKVKSSNL